MNTSPDELIAAYRAELRRLYGDAIADKTRLSYRRGWYYLKLAREFRDGSVGAIGAASAYRKSALAQMTANLRARKPKKR